MTTVPSVSLPVSCVNFSVTDGYRFFYRNIRHFAVNTNTTQGFDFLRFGFRIVDPKVNSGV